MLSVPNWTLVAYSSEVLLCLLPDGAPAWHDDKVIVGNINKKKCKVYGNNCYKELKLNGDFSILPLLNYVWYSNKYPPPLSIPPMMTRKKIAQRQNKINYFQQNSN